MTLKASVLALAAVVALGGLSACNKGGMNQGAENQGGQPMNQNFGKSYVKEIPQSEVKKKEAEMTSPQSDEKGPAVGGYDTSKADEKAEQQQDQQQNQ